MPPPKATGVAPAVCCCLAGGLLSSSCCVLQLLLNYTSIGCAGFSILTPYRHYFRLLTAGFLSYLFITQGINRRTITTTLLSCLLMVSQDLLSAQNRGSISSIQQLITSYKLFPNPQQQLAAQRTTLHVQGMRCEACAARLRGNLASIPGVDDCTVHFHSGQIEVWSNSSRPVQQQTLIEAVRATDSSYHIEVVSQECFSSDDQVVQCSEESPEKLVHKAGSELYREL